MTENQETSLLVGNSNIISSQTSWIPMDGTPFAMSKQAP